MQLSNGLANPVGLWLGHLMFDSLFSIFIATVIVVVFSTVSDKFHGPGFLVRVSPLRWRWNRVPITSFSGWPWSFTGLPARCFHTASLYSCLRRWLPSLSLRATRSSCSWYVVLRAKSTNPRSRKHVQLYLIGYLVTYTYAPSSSADKIVDKIRELVV